MEKCDFGDKSRATLGIFYDVLAELAAVNANKTRILPPKIADPIAAEIATMFTDGSDDVTFSYCLKKDEKVYYGLSTVNCLPCPGTKPK